MGNLSLWESVEKTDPQYTKGANVKGNKITSIDPQYQIMKATEKFGVYGETWGFKSIEWDFQLVEKTGLAIMKTIFYAPKIEFPIINTISVWRDGAQTKPDDQFTKKCETDLLTKALSRLGFNADIFLGKFDDQRYVDKLHREKLIYVLDSDKLKALGLHLASLETVEEINNTYKDIEKRANGMKLDPVINEVFQDATEKLNELEIANSQEGAQQ